jgi:radical SAM protein with 4Fe4S-binding SPASM domain
MLGVHGDILSCLEAISLDTPKTNPFYWGKMEAGQLIINKTKEQALQKRNTYNMPECKQCFVRWRCGGGCALMSYLEHGDIYKPVDIHCQARKMIAKEFLLFLAQGLLERSRINLQPESAQSKGIVDISTYTLSKAEIEKLQLYRDNELDERLKSKIIAILMLANGIEPQTVSSVIGTPVKIIEDWFNQYWKKGIDSLDAFQYKPKETFRENNQVELVK